MRRLACFALVAVLVSGCSRSRVVLDASSEAAATVSASDVAAGDALYPFQAASGTWGFMDAAGRVAIEATYRAAEPFSEGRAKVRVGDVYGFIDPRGAPVIPAQFTDAEAFSEGRAVVAESRASRMRYGFVDPNETVIVPTVLPLAYSFSEGRALVRIRDQDLTWFERLFRASGGESLAFIGLDGALVFDLPGESASFSNGLAPFAPPTLLAKQRWGYLHPDGSVAIAATFEGSAFRFTEGLARVTQNDIVAFIDSSGGAAFSATFELAHAFSEGLAAVRVGDLWGYIDTTGALAIAPRFELAGAFSDGLAAVRVAGQWGYIDRDGQFVVEPAYQNAHAFRGALAYVTDASGDHYIDRMGRAVRPQLVVR